MKLITFQGKTQCIKAWADDLGIKPGTLSVRIALGKPLEEILIKKLPRLDKKLSPLQLTRNSYDCMMDRCYRPDATGYENYGGRGIAVCERWRNSFDTFLVDMGYRPGGKHEYTLERINTNGNYEPENCKWATYREQNRNKRFNVKLTHNGQTKLLIDWADELGVRRSLLWGRLRNKRRPSIANILGLSTTEWHAMYRRKYTFNDFTLNAEEWAKKIGISYSTLIERMRKWGVEKSLSYGKGETIPTYTFNGKTQRLSQWAKELGVKMSMLSKRLWYGMSVDQAFSRNKRVAKQYTVNGKTQSMEAWAKDSGLKYQVLWRRVKSGMPLERALTAQDINKDRIETAKGRTLTFNGRTMTTREWASELGVSHHRMLERVKSNMTPEQMFSPKKPDQLHTFNGKTQTAGDWGRELGVSGGAIRRRIESGMSLELALTRKNINEARIPVFTYNGRTATLDAWSKELGINKGALKSRLASGMSIEEAFTRKLETHEYTVHGKTQSVGAWAKELGITTDAIRYRLKSGMSVEAALSITNRRRKAS